MYPPRIGYVVPDNLNEALQFLSEHDDAKPLAGGHSLIPMLKLRLVRPLYLVEIRRLKELNFVKKEGDYYRIGAVVTHYDVYKSKIPLLSDTAIKIADPQVRNMGTIGGSISHADPSADYQAALTAMDAEVVVSGLSGSRRVKFTEFIKDMYTPDLRQDELVTEVIVKDYQGYTWDYEKLERKAGDFAIVGVAVLARKEGNTVKDLRVGLTAVSNKGVRAREVESVLLDREPNEDLINRAASEVLKSINPVSDIRGTSEYKKKVAAILTRRALKKALGVM